MIKGEKILLGPLLPSDAGPLFRWVNDVEAAAFDLSYRPVDGMGFQAWFNGIGNDPNKVVFAIRKIDAAAIIGYVQIKNIDPVHRGAELGIRIGDEIERGQGYGTEALRLAQSYSWDTLNLKRLALTVFGGNERAIKAYEAAGFACEGTLRCARYVAGAWTDLLILGILRPQDRPA